MVIRERSQQPNQDDLEDDQILTPDTTPNETPGDIIDLNTHEVLTAEELEARKKAERDAETQRKIEGFRKTIRPKVEAMKARKKAERDAETQKTIEGFRKSIPPKVEAMKARKEAGKRAEREIREQMNTDTVLDQVYMDEDHKNELRKNCNEFSTAIDNARAKSNTVAEFIKNTRDSVAQTVLQISDKMETEKPRGFGRFKKLFSRKPDEQKMQEHTLKLLEVFLDASGSHAGKSIRGQDRNIETDSTLPKVI